MLDPNGTVDLLYTYYETDPFIINATEDGINLARRENNAGDNWGDGDARRNPPKDRLKVVGLTESTQEIILAEGGGQDRLAGDVFDDPIIVGSLPFVMTGSFSDYDNDIQFFRNQPDIFFRIVAPACDNVKLTVQMPSGAQGNAIYDQDGNRKTGGSGGSSGTLILEPSFILNAGEEYTYMVAADGDFTVTVEAVPYTADLLPPSEVCLAEGSSFNLRADAPSTGGSFAWRKDGTLLSNTSSQLNVTEEGLYELTFTYGAACSIVDQTQVFFDADPGTLSGPSVVTPLDPFQLLYDQPAGGPVTLESLEGGTWLPYTNANSVQTASGYVFNIAPLTGESTRQFRVKQNNGNCGTEISNEIEVLVQSLQGDNEGSPIIIGSLPASIAGSNQSSSDGSFTDTFDLSEGGQNSPDVFYLFTAPACSEEITISTCDSDINTVVHVLQADGTLFATADDNSCGDDEAITFSATPFTDYMIVVEGAGAAVGNFQLDIAVQEFEFDLGEDFILCPGQEATIGVPIPGASYSWNTGATDDLITVSTPGTYEVTITNAAGCTKTDNISIISSPSTTPFILPFYSVPDDGETGQEVNVELSWISLAPTHDLFLWKEGETEQLLAGDVAETSYQLENLDPGTTYNWKFIAHDFCRTTSAESDVFSFSTLDLPDLEVIEIAFDPTTVILGEDVSITWKYTNNGNQPVAGEGGQIIILSNKVYLSRDPVLDEGTGGDFLLEDNFELVDFELAASSTTADNTEYIATLPINGDLTPGDYYVIVETLPPFDEINSANNLTRSVELLTIEPIPVPDLAVTNLTSAESEVAAGDFINVSYEISNIGTKDIDVAIFDDIYLSPSAGTFNNNDLIGTNSITSNLAVNASIVSGNVFLRIDDNFPPGDYFLHLFIDAVGGIEEANESNNIVTGNLVTIKPFEEPDFQAVQVQTSSMDVETSSNIVVEWEVQNVGTGAPPSSFNSWVDAIYLSTDADCDDLENCAILAGRFSHGNNQAEPLENGVSYLESRSVFLNDDDLVAGDYYLFVVSNTPIGMPPRQVPEATFNNNVAVSSTPISITKSPNPTGPCGDNFINACVLDIPLDGFGYLTDAPLDNVDLTDATVEANESFSPGMANDKSLWYKFTIETTRFVSINLEGDQNLDHRNNGSQIGVSIFQEPAFGGLPQITKSDNTSDLAGFPQLYDLGTTVNTCLSKGTYFIRISAGSNYLANVPLNVTVDVTAEESDPDSNPTSVVGLSRQHDRPINAYFFPNPLGHRWQDKTFETGCLSVDSPEELDLMANTTLGKESQYDPSLVTNPVPLTDYDQTAWFVFRTDDHTDALRMRLKALSDFQGINQVGYRHL